MENILKQINNLKKQNDGMEASFKTKNISFTKMHMDNLDPDTELILLKEYNEYLKEISKSNRPPPKEQPVAVADSTAPIQKDKKEKPKKDDDEDDDDIIKEIKPTYSTITNMEDIKRAFFCREYDNFNTLIRQHPFKFYKVNYKYSSDNTGKPSYIAKNLLRGFVQGLDDYRKYLMVCFRCILVDKDSNEYIYPSYWIINSNDDIKNILGSLYDDYDFDLLDKEEDISKLLKDIEKIEDETNDTLIGEVYVH